MQVVENYLNERFFPRQTGGAMNWVRLNWNKPDIVTRHGDRSLFRKKMSGFPPTPQKDVYMTGPSSRRKRSRSMEEFFSSIKKMRLRSGRKYGYRRNYRRRYRKRNYGTGVTKDRDVVLQYKYKKMPRYKKRKYVGFVKKVYNVMNSAAGTKTVVFNHAITGNLTAYSQTIHCAAIGGCKGLPDDTLQAGFGDLWKIFNNDPNITKTAGPGVKLTDGKLMFTSMILDVTLYNKLTDTSKKKEIDVYDIVFSKKNIDADSVIAMMVKSFGDTPVLGTGTGLSILDRGVTPFEAVKAGGYGMRVLRKYKYYVEENGTLTFQLRLNKPKLVDASQVENATDSTNAVTYTGNFNYPGVTRALFFITKNVDGTDAKGDDLRLGVTRTYRYHKHLSASSQDCYLLGNAAYP